MCELISQRGTVLQGITLKLKGNPPAGDGGLQYSLKEGARGENKVSGTFFFSSTQISPGLLCLPSIFSFAQLIPNRVHWRVGWAYPGGPAPPPPPQDRSQVYGRAHFRLL